MKKKTLLPLAGLVLLSGVAAVSGTFAWFQTARTASISFTDATVRSKGTNIKVTYVGSKNTMEEAPVDGSVITPVAGDASIELEIKKLDGVDQHDAQFITDISGDGATFLKPEWGHTANNWSVKEDGVSWYNAYEINEITDAMADGHFIDFTIKVERDELTVGAGNDLMLYLGADTVISPVTPADDNDEAAVAASRMSVYDVDSGDAILFYAPVAEPGAAVEVELDDSYGVGKKYLNDPQYSYLEKTLDAQDVAYGLEEYKISDLTGVAPVVNAFVDVPAPDTNKTAAADGYLTTLNAINPSITLNFRIWIEGTDSDVGLAHNNALDGKISSLVTLYANEMA